MSEIYRSVVAPFLDGRDSETWHVRAREALHAAELSPITLWLLEKIAAYKGERFKNERLEVVVGGVEFENPLLVGAGWDKPGRAVKALHRLGFAGVEVGSVPAHPQIGNPKPRQWMVGPGVAMNKLGFNSPGMKIVAKNLERYKGSGIPIGISVTINKEVSATDAPEAHAKVVNELYEHATYLALNVSSPNTPGLRALQDKKLLTDNVQAINGVMDAKGVRKPFFVKIAPELTDIEVDDVIDVVLDNGLTGIIATNTTINDEIKAKYGKGGEVGGFSGNDCDYRNLSTKIIIYIRKVAGNGFEIIGVAGIHDAQTAVEKIKAGAKVVQAVTGIREVGPTLPGRINRGIIEYMDQTGVKNVNELVGVGVKA